MRRNMIESMVIVCLARSAHSRGRRDVDASRDYRISIKPSQMEAVRISLLYPHVLDESVRERPTDLDGLRDDLLWLLLLPEILSIDRIRSEYDRQLECTEDGTEQLGQKERRNMNISRSDGKRLHPQPRRFAPTRIMKSDRSNNVGQTDAPRLH
jgi:hypothetical protein